MKKHDTFAIIFNYIVSLLFSFIIILMKEINFNPNAIPKDFINNFNFDLVFFGKTILISIPIFFGIYLLFYILDRIRINEDKKVENLKLVCLISFIGIFISGLMFLITYYPGSGMTDTFDILTTPIGVAHKHPLLYNLAITVPYRVFYTLFNNMNLSFFLIGLLQLIVIDCVITFLIGWFYNTVRNKIASILLMIYFIFTPIIANYNTAIVKDSIFAIMLLSFIPILYSIITSNGKWIKSKKNLLITIIFFTLTTLVRNNGIFVVIFILVLLCITYRKYLLQWTLILLIILVISKSISFVPGIKESLFQEKVGIPIQQIAYVIYTDGNISDNDKDYLNKVFTIKEFKEKYHPYYVDMLKWDDNFNRNYLNETSNKFLKVWFNLLPNNFSGYVKSYLMTTYGTWAPSDFENTQSRFLGFSSFDISNFSDFKEIRQQRIWPEEVQKFLVKFYDNTTTYLSTGSCVWILILTCLYIVYKKKYSYLLLTTPLVAIFGTLMIATPLSTAFRYMVPFAYLMPFILLIIFSLNKEKDKTKTSQK